MLRLFNTLGRRLEKFQPVNQNSVSVFTCGPSVYQRAHIGNFRTFLFEDILVRYLEYSGYRVTRGMNFTDVEDKAIKEAKEQNVSVKALTQHNIKVFIREMELLRIRIPEYLPRASEAVDRAADIIEQLLDRGIAYRHKCNVYFDPLKYPGFGELYGLDMDSWPKTKRRFHRDTYPGMRWNRGDFILWHGSQGESEISWNTRIGKGRPSWNIQDPSMIVQHFNETLSVYCGGYDNLIRHHDYSRAILESIRPYPMAKYWLHCRHLHVNGEKMSKSKGNAYYTDTLLSRGYKIDEIRFFLIYGHYRENLNYSDNVMDRTAENLRDFKRKTRAIDIASKEKLEIDEEIYHAVRLLFSTRMDQDLDVRGAFDELHGFLAGPEARQGSPRVSAGILKALMEIDEVLQLIF